MVHPSLNGLRALTAAPSLGYAAGRMARPAVNAEGDDVALLAAVVAGRQRALALLYDRYAGLLTAVGLRVLGHPREVEDLVHDVFVEAWRQAGQYDPARGTVRAWLVMRMRSRALDRKKAAAWSRSVPLDGAGPEPAAPSVGPAPDGERLRAALAALPAEQREVLELAYFEGLASPEIAARVGVPVGTVKSRTAAAMARLRRVLGEGR